MSVLSEWEAGQLAALEQEIAVRLRPVCPNTSEAEFDALVKRIALVRRKYEQRRHQELFRMPEETAEASHEQL